MFPFRSTCLLRDSMMPCCCMPSPCMKPLKMDTVRRMGQRSPCACGTEHLKVKHIAQLRPNSHLTQVFVKTGFFLFYSNKSIQALFFFFLNLHPNENTLLLRMCQTHKQQYHAHPKSMLASHTKLKRRCWPFRSLKKCCYRNAI